MSMRRQHQEAARRLQANQQEVRRLQKLDRNRQRREQREPSTAVLDIAVRIVALRDGDFVDARQFLASKAARAAEPLAGGGGSEATGSTEPLAGHPPPAPDLWKAALERKWEGLSAADRAALLSAPAGVPTCRLQAAQKFLAETSLSKWVEHQNGKALAPTGPAVLAEARRLTEKSARAGGVSLPIAAKSQSRKQWVRRWARRCGLQRGRFKEGNRLDLTVARSKARRMVRVVAGVRNDVQPVQVFGLCAGFRGPHFVPGIRARFGARKHKLRQEVCPDSGPHYVPTFDPTALIF